MARRNRIEPNKLFTCRQLASQGTLTAAGAEEEAAHSLEIAGGSKNAVVARLVAQGWSTIKAINDTLRTVRSNLAVQAKAATQPAKWLGRSSRLDDSLVANIEAVIAGMPT